jgi:hypothetical protein
VHGRNWTTASRKGIEARPDGHSDVIIVYGIDEPSDRIFIGDNCGGVSRQIYWSEDGTEFTVVPDSASYVGDPVSDFDSIDTRTGCGGTNQTSSILFMGAVVQVQMDGTDRLSLAGSTSVGPWTLEAIPFPGHERNAHVPSSRPSPARLATVGDPYSPSFVDARSNDPGRFRITNDCVVYVTDSHGSEYTTLWHEDVASFDGDSESVHFAGPHAGPVTIHDGDAFAVLASVMTKDDPAFDQLTITNAPSDLCPDQYLLVNRVDKYGD